MTRGALIATLCALLGLSGYAWWLQGRNTDLTGSLAAARTTISVRDRQLEQSHEASRVLDAHLGRMSDERARLDVEINHLRQLEGYYAPLSDFQRNAFDSM